MALACLVSQLQSRLQILFVESQSRLPGHRPDEPTADKAHEPLLPTEVLERVARAVSVVSDEVNAAGGEAVEAVAVGVAGLGRHRVALAVEVGKHGLVSLACFNRDVKGLFLVFLFGKS